MSAAKNVVPTSYLTGIIQSVALNVNKDGEFRGRDLVFSIGFINENGNIARSIQFTDRNDPRLCVGNIEIGERAYMAGTCTKVSTNESASAYAYFVVEGTSVGIALNKDEFGFLVVDEATARNNAEGSRKIFSTSWTIDDVLESAADQEFLGIEDPAAYDIAELREKNVFGRIARTLEDVVGERGFVSNGRA